MQAISNVIGAILRFIYENIQQMFSEPKNISYFAISIIVLTVIYKLATLPVTFSNIKMQKVNAKMAPEMKKIQETYKNDPQTQQRKMAELQKEHGFNPLSSCLPMIIQMIVVFALFRVMREPAKYMFDNAEMIGSISKNFLWINDLTLPDKLLWGLPLINGISQFFLFNIMQPPQTEGAGGEMAQSMNASMKYVMPLFIAWTSTTLSAGLALYWAIGNIIEIVIRLIIKAFDKDEKANKKINKTNTKKAKKGAK